MGVVGRRLGSEFEFVGDAPQAVGRVVQHVAEMAVARGDREMVVDDVGGVEGPPVRLGFHQAADGLILVRFLPVFGCQSEIASEKQDGVSLKDIFVVVREAEQADMRGFGRTDAGVQQERSREGLEQL